MPPPATASRPTGRPHRGEQQAGKRPGHAAGKRPRLHAEHRFALRVAPVHDRVLPPRPPASPGHHGVRRESARCRRLPAAALKATSSPQLTFSGKAARALPAVRRNAIERPVARSGRNRRPKAACQARVSGQVGRMLRDVRVQRHGRRVLERGVLDRPCRCRRRNRTAPVRAPARPATPGAGRQPASVTAMRRCLAADDSRGCARPRCPRPGASQHPHRQTTLAPVVDAARAAVAGAAVDDHDLLRRTASARRARAAVPTSPARSFSTVTTIDIAGPLTTTRSALLLRPPTSMMLRDDRARSQYAHTPDRGVASRALPAVLVAALCLLVGSPWPSLNDASNCRRLPLAGAGWRCSGLHAARDPAL